MLIILTQMVSTIYSGFNKIVVHHVFLMWWSLYKYKYLWIIESKGQGSSIQEGAIHIYN